MSDLSSWLLSLAREHLDGLFVELCVPLNHELLECDEVVDGRDLVHNLAVQLVRTCLLACVHELVLGHSQLCHQFTQQIIHDLLEFLYRDARGMLYVVYDCILQLVFLLIVKNQAVFIEEAHDWRLPTRTS